MMQDKFYKIYLNISGMEIVSVTQRTIEEYKEYILNQRAGRIEIGASTFLHDAILLAIENGNYELVDLQPSKDRTRE